MIAFKSQISRHDDHRDHMGDERNENHKEAPNRLRRWIFGVGELEYFPVFHEIHLKKKFPDGNYSATQVQEMH